MGFDAGSNKDSYTAKKLQLRNLIGQVDGDAGRYKMGCGTVHIHLKCCGLVLSLHCSHSCLVSPCVVGTCNCTASRLRDAKAFTLTFFVVLVSMYFMLCSCSGLVVFATIFCDAPC